MLCRSLESASAYAHLLEFREGLIDVMFSKGLVALGALVYLISQLLVNQFIREIDAIEADREVIYELEIFILAVVTEEIVMNEIHSPILLEKQ
jgi:hypothetical protein